MSGGPDGERRGAGSLPSSSSSLYLHLSFSGGGSGVRARAQRLGGCFSAVPELRRASFHPVFTCK